MHHHAKRRQNLPNGYGDIVDFSIFKMVAVRHFGFFTLELRNYPCQILCQSFQGFWDSDPPYLYLHYTVSLAGRCYEYNSVSTQLLEVKLHWFQMADS